MNCDLSFMLSAVYPTITAALWVVLQHDHTEHGHTEHAQEATALIIKSLMQWQNLFSPPRRDSCHFIFVPEVFLWRLAPMNLLGPICPWAIIHGKSPWLLGRN